MLDLYRALGIRKNASPAAVEKAYRRRAKETHPDRGGDRIEFERCDLAYRVLMDPECRSRYDQTGEVSPPRPDDTLGKTMNVLASVLANVIQQIVDQGSKPEVEDILKHMRTVITGRRDAIRQQRAKVQKYRVALETAAARFVVAEGENLIESVARGQMAQADQQLAAMDAEAETFKKAAGELEKYKYSFKAQPAVMPLRWYATTTGASS